MAVSGGYSFPILEVDECVAFFRELANSAISEEDFKKPEHRRWQIFYGTIYELMTGRPADFVAQTRLNAVSNCEYSELHDESFSLMAFAMVLVEGMTAAPNAAAVSGAKIFSGAGILDFTVRDLLDLKPRRLLRNVSAAINFIRFGGSREEVFSNKKEELARQRESYEYVLKENAELKKALQAKRETHPSQVLKMKQLQEENDTISFRIQELHKQQEAHQRTLSEVKNEMSLRNSSNDQLKVNILNVQAEGEKLSQRIVQSPERVKAEQDRAKNRIMALKSTVEEKQRRFAELYKQKEAATVQQQNAESAVRLLKDISNDSDRLQDLEKGSARQHDVHQDLRSASLELAAKLDNLRQVQMSRQEKLSKMDLQYQSKKSSMQEHISQLSHLKETLYDPRGTSESRKSSLVREKENLKQDVKAKEDELEEKVERANTVYFEILQQVDKTNLEVANGFNQFRSIMKF